MAGGQSVFIFAGTSEGRELAVYLAGRGLPCTVSVATEYGGLLLPSCDGVTILQGRMTSSDMRGALAGRDYCCVLDATHPFAVTVSAEIRAACESAGLPYFRLARRTEAEEGKDAVCFATMAEAASWLEVREGNILVTTGSKELPQLAAAISDNSRLYVRVLPSVPSIQACAESGISGSHIIAMQGPFSQELNALLLREVRASFLLTKETGLAGGYGEKLAAAAQCGVTAVVIRNPEAQTSGAPAHTLSQVLEKVEELTGLSLLPERPNIVLAGFGPGSPGLISAELRQSLEEADVIFGVPRLLAALSQLPFLASKPLVPHYRYRQFADYLDAHPSCRKPLVVFSGDSGFYSGAASFLREADGHFDCTVLCGLSSLSYFAARIGRNWEDWTLLSSHGRDCPVAETLRTHPRCFLLLAGAADVRQLGICLEEAVANGVLSAVEVTLGYQLSYPEEAIVRPALADLRGVSAEGLYVALLEHAGAEGASLVPGLPDDAFIRSSVPLTKREVRTLVISRLQLTRHAVVYDIGSGTGSVTVETARVSPGGFVYALDCEEEAVSLTRRNVARFCLRNVQVLHALAPEGLAALPAPTHVFIGGSKGRLAAILAAVLRKNPLARLVLTAVSLETLVAVRQALEGLPVTEPDYTQVAVSRAERLGGSHLLRAQNPVFIVSCTGRLRADGEH